MMKTTVLFVFFFTFAFSCVNSSVTCSSSNSSVLACSVGTTNSTLIQETIAARLGNGDTKLEIVVGAGGRGAVLNIPLSEIMTALTINNNARRDIFVETHTVNSGVTFISFLRFNVVILQNNFFSFFPNLETLEAYKLEMGCISFLTQNKELTKINIERAKIVNESSRVIDHDSFAGLEKLEFLQFTQAGITEIQAGSFRDLTNLRELYLDGNEIKSLESCMFEGLENLETLSLSGNGINSVHSNAFLGLSKLSELVLSQNPSMQLTSVTALKALQILQLSELNSTNILPEIIQQLTNLTTLDLNSVVFDCTCKTEWLSKLASFDITVSFGSATCLGDSQVASEPLLYSSCPDRSFQCFNKSIECVGENWNRVATPDGCDCVYPNASYTASQICNETNECEESSICQGNCTNTIGSYRCSCLEGFYNMNDTLCADINECNSDNGNCSQKCDNSPGSFTCSCLVGYQKVGSSGCVDINECQFDNGNCSHNCSNTIGSYECSCLPGYMQIGSTECSLPNTCSHNSGGCHHNCTDRLDGYECSCLEGFKVSLLNSSHCEVDAVTGNNANSKESSFYVLLFVCCLFLATIILLFVLLVLVFLYFRKQIQSVNAKLASKGVVLTQLEAKPEAASPQLDSSPNQQEPAEEPNETFNNICIEC